MQWIDSANGSKLMGAFKGPVSKRTTAEVSADANHETIWRDRLPYSGSQSQNTAYFTIFRLGRLISGGALGTLSTSDLGPLPGSGGLSS